MVRGGLRYVAAIVFAGAGAGVLFALDATVGRPFYSILTICVMLSAWFGGMGPGILTSVLGALTINYFFQAPRYTFAVASLSEGIQLSIFIVAALMMSVLIKSRNEARETAASATHRALHDPLTRLPNRVLLEAAFPGRIP